MLEVGAGCGVDARVRRKSLGGKGGREERFLTCAGRRVRRSERGGRNRPAPFGMTFFDWGSYVGAEAPTPSCLQGSRKKEVERQGGKERIPLMLRMNGAPTSCLLSEREPPTCRLLRQDAVQWRISTVRCSYKRLAIHALILASANVSFVKFRQAFSSSGNPCG